jgi:Protein of unknown function (DUF3108)
MIKHLRLGPAAAFSASLLLVALQSEAGQAGIRIEVRYAVTYLHLTIGTGRWSLNMRGNRYTSTASGQVKGMMRLLINGEGSGRADGVVAGNGPSATRFAAHVVSTAENDDISIVFQNGAVKQLRAAPAFPPIPKRVTVTAADLVDVSDPLSAALAFTGGRNPNVCDRRLQIFDGRRRFDVALSYKRTKNIRVPPAFDGSGIVCSAQVFPIAGQRLQNSALKYLAESKDLEIEYASVPDVRAYIPIAATVPTLIGAVHVKAIGLTIMNSAARE